MKLTKTIKENIIDQAVAAAFDAKLEKAKRGIVNELADRSKDTKLLQRDDVPEQFHKYIHWSTQVYLYQRTQMNIEIRFPVEVALEYGCYSLQSSSGGDYESPATKVYTQLLKQKNEFRITLKEGIMGITTSNKLAEVFPALTKYLPADGGLNLPIPIATIDRINAVLNKENEE